MPYLCHIRLPFPVQGCRDFGQVCFVHDVVPPENRRSLVARDFHDGLLISRRCRQTSSPSSSPQYNARSAAASAWSNSEKSFLSHKNRVVVFSRNGDAIFSHSDITLGDSVQGACDAVKQDKSRSVTLHTLADVWPTGATSGLNPPGSVPEARAGRREPTKTRHARCVAANPLLKFPWAGHALRQRAG